MRRSAVIHMRIDPAARSALAAAAQASGVSLSSWLRNVGATAAVAGDTGTGLADELVLVRRELARAGNNLNQLAKTVHTSGTVDTGSLDAAVSEIRRLGGDIGDVLARVSK